MNELIEKLKHLNELSQSEQFDVLSQINQIDQDDIVKNTQVNIRWVDPSPLPDAMQIYFKEPYQVTDKITLKQPTIQDIINVGEKQFYSVLLRLIGNTTMFRVFLWDLGMDWNKMYNFDLFRLWVQIDGFPKEVSDIFFEDVDFSLFKEYLFVPPDEMEKPEAERKEKSVLYDAQNDILITEAIYKRIANYYRRIFNIYPKVQKTRGKTTKRDLIEEDKANEKFRAQMGEESGSMIMSLISFCLNHPGFKYKKDELREIGIAEFMDSVNRLQVYEATRAAMTGSYSGFVDTSKMDKELFDFTRDITNKKKNDVSSALKEKQKNAIQSLNKDDGTLKNKIDKF